MTGLLLYLAVCLAAALVIVIVAAHWEPHEMATCERCQELTIRDGEPIAGWAIPVIDWLHRAGLAGERMQPWVYLGYGLLAVVIATAFVMAWLVP